MRAHSLRGRTEWVPENAWIGSEGGAAADGSHPIRKGPALSARKSYRTTGGNAFVVPLGRVSGV